MIPDGAGVVVVLEQSPHTPLSVQHFPSGQSLSPPHVGDGGVVVVISSQRPLCPHV